MSLSEDQVSKCMFYLGYTADGAYQNTLILDWINNVDGYNQVRVVETLTELDALKVVFNTLTRSVAGLKRADTVEFYQGANLSEIKSQGSTYTQSLASIIGVDVGPGAFFKGAFTNFRMPTYFY